MRRRYAGRPPPPPPAARPPPARAARRVPPSERRRCRAAACPANGSSRERAYMLFYEQCRPGEAHRQGHSPDTAPGVGAAEVRDSEAAPCRQSTQDTAESCERLLKPECKSE
ncbi:MAG: hypothetical protein WDW36_005712 [Sanguina aurantia]